MDYKLISAPLDKAEYLFFAASLKHRSIFYKLAVAEEVSYFQPGFNGRYCVLMQCETGTSHFVLHKDEQEAWVSDDPQVLPEIVFLIGSQIETIKE